VLQDGNTCLHLAAERGDLDLVVKLFQCPNLDIALKNEVSANTSCEMSRSKA
jgi:hypothetical protein